MGRVKTKIIKKKLTDIGLFGFQLDLDQFGFLDVGLAGYFFRILV
jgi:hypothetical protein